MFENKADANDKLYTVLITARGLNAGESLTYSGDLLDAAGEQLDYNDEPYLLFLTKDEFVAAVGNAERNK